MIVNVEGHLTLKRYNMPAMPRPDNKARKIAYKILGKPSNIAFKRNKIQAKINARLTYEDTYRVR